MDLESNPILARMLRDHLRKALELTLAQKRAVQNFEPTERAMELAAHLVAAAGYLKKALDALPE